MATHPSQFDARRAERHPADFALLGEHRTIGDVPLRMINVSAQGFMATGTVAIGRGERVVIGLPVVGRIEAHLIWATDGRLGFQFERIIRAEVFQELLLTLRPRAALRRHG